MPNTPTSAAEAVAYLSVLNVAEKLVISDQTVRNMIHRGELHAIKAGRQYRIPTSELVRILSTPATPMSA